MGNPFQYPEIETEAERLARAADQAVKDGDYEHARDLMRRARNVRRRDRESAHGIPNPWAWS